MTGKKICEIVKRQSGTEVERNTVKWSGFPRDKHFANWEAEETGFLTGKFELDAGKFEAMLLQIREAINSVVRAEEEINGPPMRFKLWDENSLLIEMNGAIGDAYLKGTLERIRKSAYDAGVICSAETTPVSIFGKTLGCSKILISLHFMRPGEIDSSTDLAGGLAGNASINIDTVALVAHPKKIPDLSKLQAGQLYYLLRYAKSHLGIDRMDATVEGDSIVLRAYCGEPGYYEGEKNHFSMKMAELQEKTGFTKCTMRDADGKDGHFFDLVIPCKKP
ncbi:MAG: hypothetical protein NTX79_06665 [Candidatus Micrarchaeota archaeon]|nr:hypothetical protein [Candidatus Micrarchaeota archaeon]